MLYLTGRLQVTNGLLWAHKENDSIKGRKDDVKLMFNQDYTGHGTSSWVVVVVRAVVVVSVVVKCMLFRCCPIMLFSPFLKMIHDVPRGVGKMAARVNRRTT